MFDEVIVGTPAFGYGQQQVQHLYSNVVEQTLNYYPPPYELSKIVNATIAACDSLDGLIDGVVSRTDLCALNFNINSTISLPYSCAASSSSSSSLGLGYGPQNGTVTAEGLAVAQNILDGLVDSDGKRAYISYQPTADFEDAATAYDSSTDSWELDIASTGGEWVGKFLELLGEANMAGDDVGSNAQICESPKRPLWTGSGNATNGTDFGCVFDEEIYQTWNYTFDAYKLPLY